MAFCIISKEEEAMRYNDRDYERGAGSLMLSFLLGGLVGAAAAFIFAPKSGRETREQILDMAQEAKEKAAEYYDQAKTKITTTVQKGTEVLQHKKTEKNDTDVLSQTVENTVE
jgi:gas vesicle protein